MISLKEKYIDRVIIIGGNRDFNKLRLGIELFLVGINPKTNKPFNNIEDLLRSYNKHGDQCISEMLKDTTIDFNQKKVPEYVKIDTGSITEMQENFKTTNHKFFSRVFTIFDKSMGIPFVVYMSEIRDIMIKQNLLTEQEILRDGVILEIERLKKKKNRSN